MSLTATGSTRTGVSEPMMAALAMDVCRIDSKNPASGEGLLLREVPGKVEAGIVSFELDNRGKELHEAAVLRKNDDVTESFDALLELPEEEAMEKVTFMGSACGAPDEEGAFGVVDLTAGDYIMVCFIPQGTMGDETEGEGRPTSRWG